ncbi:MAG: reverse transcriptase domain-containing protein, partial [Kosmotogaceae bacterium]
AKAVKQSRWNKVKVLQRILTRSLSAKILSVLIVTTNKGAKTAGIDRVIWETKDDKVNAVLSLKKRGYKPLPLRRIYIPKKDKTKLRPLSIPTMHDRAMQALYKLALEPVAEATADLNSYGFRMYRCPADAIQQIFICLAKSYHAQWIFEADIKSCFDQISHQWLTQNIPMDKTVLNKWLKAGYIENYRKFNTEIGTPQGGIISPLLMNMTLDGMEEEIRLKFPKWKAL